MIVPRTVTPAQARLSLGSGRALSPEDPSLRWDDVWGGWIDAPPRQPKTRPMRTRTPLGSLTANS